jgi:aminomuconate-semialdehyde/2-hydroxymuconate-6-semialdehyde dehydrogenase
MKIADKIEEYKEEFIKYESMDNGKGVTLCRNLDIPRAIANFRFFAEEIKQ